MSRFTLARTGFAALALFLPAFCLSTVTGCGSSQTDAVVTAKTTQAEQDQIDAEMRANEAELLQNKTKKK